MKRANTRKTASNKMFTRTRALTFEKRAGGEGDEPVFDVAISSETDTVERWFGTEVLLHGRGNVDLSRLKTVAGVLMNHDPDQLVGAIVDPRVDPDRILRIGVRFDPTEAGQNARMQMENGSLRGASLQYAYDEFREIPAGKTVKVNGQDVNGPARIVKRWMVIEPTLTPVPADASVGVGRSKEKVMFKWQVVSADGSETKRFRTRKDAEAWVEEQDAAEEWKVGKIETDKKRSDDDAPPAEPAPEHRKVDEKKIAERAKREYAAACRDLRELGDMADEREYAEDIIGDGEDFNLADARREITERWQAKKCKDRKPPANPEPPRKHKRGLDSLDDDTFLRNATRRHLSDIHIESRPGLLRAQDYRDLLANDQGDFQRRLNELLSRTEGVRMTPDQFSLKAAYEMYDGINVRQLVRDPTVGERLVTSSAFGVITGSVLIAKVREAYENVNTVGQDLVTEMENSESVATIPAVLTEESIREVQEGESYGRSGAAEEYVTIPSKKQGGIVPVTREAIARDQTGVILLRVNQLAEDAVNAIEKHTLRQVTDQDTLTYRPSGTATALYTTTARARGTNQVNSNALVDSTDLDNARAKLAAMVKNNGDPVNVQPRILLVPDALIGLVTKLLGSEMTPGVANELNPWGPRGMWRPNVRTSPFLDTFGTGTTDWYLGDPKKQFIRKQAFGIETTTKGADSEAAFDSDVVFQAKVAFDIYVGAIDYVYMVKSQSAA